MSSSPTDERASDAEDRYARLLEVLSLLAGLSREIGPAFDLDGVLQAVLRATRSLVDCDGGAISLLEGDELVIMAGLPAEAHLEGSRIPVSANLAGILHRRGESALSNDVAADERINDELKRAAATRGIAAYLGVPLTCLGEVIGVLHVWSARIGAFDADHQLLLEGLSIQVAGAIEGARRYRMISELEVLKSDFIARVSHELRTPITIVSGFVGTLLSNHERLDSDTRRRMLERVDIAAARLSGLIDQLLMLSRLETGVVAASSESVDAATLLEEVRRQSERPGAVEVTCPENLRWTTDPALLLRALGFLVDNALKYAGHCEIVATEQTIAVVDRGPGIAVEQRPHVFERFTRANTDTTVPGMGIGLPMARTLLAAAGADLAIAEPPDGVGTRMVARFW